MKELLYLFDPAFIQAHTSIRNGEKKLGQTLRTLTDEGDLDQAIRESGARVALLFVPEDIGVRANLGRAGASATWKTALKGICNMQDNSFLQGQDILILGAVAVDDLMDSAKNLNPDNDSELAQLRELTSKVDDRVRTLVASIFSAGLFPIIIGGGHNNVYPILASWCDVSESVLSVINLDPHADYREMEGRHSGNGFRYAHEEGALDRYAVVGLHEAYNSASMFHLLREDPDLRYTTFEDIAVRQIIKYRQAVNDSLDFVSEGSFGIELDLDTIPQVPVSAATPTGFSLEQARHYVYEAAGRKESAYLHICEGSAGLASDDQLPGLAKTIACLVSDAIKAKNENRQ